MRCFERLGLNCRATERDVKKAFHRLARETHPDMVQDESLKQAAAVAFRQVYEAYEEAMEYCKTGRERAPRETEPAAGRNSERPSWSSESHIRKVFQDICEELQREQDEKHRKRNDETRCRLRETWSNGRGASACWEMVKFEPPWTIQAFVQDFRPGNDASLIALAEFLENQHRLKSQQQEEMTKSVKQELADYVVVNWSDQNKIRTYVASSFVNFAIGGGVYDLLPDESMKRALKQICSECGDAILRERKTWLEEVARQIEDAYPNQVEMRNILGNIRILLSLDWRTIMELLSPEVREAVAALQRNGALTTTTTRRALSLEST